MNISFKGNYDNGYQQKRNINNQYNSGQNPNIQRPSNNTYNQYGQQQRQYGQRSRYDNQDSWQPQNKNTNKSARKNIAIPVTAVVASLLTALTITHPFENTPSTVQIQFDNTTDNITEIAEVYNIDEEIIERYNGIITEDDLAEKESLKIPSAYDYISEEIEKIQEKLYSDDLKPEKREEYEEKILALQNKLELQQQYAKTYTDGKDVFWIIKKDVNVEEFKDIFDIKDGALKNHNDIDFTYETDEFGDSLMNYTGATLPKGKLLHVPVSAIKTGNKIELDGFTD